MGFLGGYFACSCTIGLQLCAAGSVHYIPYLVPVSQVEALAEFVHSLASELVAMLLDAEDNDMYIDYSSDFTMVADRTASPGDIPHGPIEVQSGKCKNHGECLDTFVEACSAAVFHDTSISKNTRLMRYLVISSLVLPMSCLVSSLWH